MDPAPPVVARPGCLTCAIAARHEHHHRRTHDHSAAADGRGEIRNHPDDEPKLTLPGEPP
ncbi:hypothetical protein [Streptomyces sp. NPDC085529]|uniref:hypothetical protein n=1 Tax=Streptomyces sp. NPDC085529 TaxID=3365729 RepID=UPI0037D73657